VIWRTTQRALTRLWHFLTTGAPVSGIFGMKGGCVLPERRALSISRTWPAQCVASARRALPGLLLSSAVAAGASLGAPPLARIIQIPAMVIALFIGITLNSLARRPSFQPGIVFCLKTILRWAVALLGLRIALGDIAALGSLTAVLVMVAMAVTIGAGFLLARAFGRESAYGALAGAGTAVCGASATLATSIVLPDYKGKETDVAFIVVAVNALSTVAMVLYPLVCASLGFDSQTTGVMLGATIHDVAQVVGAGYAVSETTGNTAVIVKLFRVFLMLPLVLLIGWSFSRRTVTTAASNIPIPVFALVFVVLCILNSIAAGLPDVTELFNRIKAPLVEASSWGLLVAISALGLGTSVGAVLRLGWAHVAVVIGTTLVILLAVTAGLVMLQ
jgi:uncharacterized integral membrane protein (TIGR00698 family)